MLVNSYIYLDPDVNLFCVAAGISSYNQKYATNTFVKRLKLISGTSSLWSRFIAIYPLVGGSATSHKFNLKDPRDVDAAFRLVFSGGITHNGNGVTGNGTNGYANTKIIPSTSLSLNSTSMFVYSRTNVAGAYVDIGNILTNRLQINGRNATDFFTSAVNDATLISNSSTNSSGFIGISRTSSSVYVQSRNTTQITATASTTALPTIELYFMAQNASGPVNYSPRNYSLAMIGGGLTDTECDNLYTYVQEYQTLLGRAI